MTNKIELRTKIKQDQTSWASLWSRSPTLQRVFFLYPELISIEITFINIGSKYITLGSPNSWIRENGRIISAENTTPPAHILDHIWRIGRDITEIETPLRKEIHSQKSISILFFPNMICVRDEEQLQELAEKTWSGQNTSKTCLISHVLIPDLQKVAHFDKRLNAQFQQLSQIYSADLGQEISVIQPELEVKTKNSSTRNKNE